MKKKRFRAIILLAGLLFSAVGCGKTDEAGSGSGTNDDKVNQTGNTVSWNVSHTALGDLYELATVRGNKIYGCYYTGEGLTVSVQDIGVDENGSEEKKWQIPGVTEIQNITVDSQNQICLFGATEKGNTLWQIGQDGEINSIENIWVENLGHLPSLKAFYADSNGYYYLWYSMTVPCAEVYENGEEGIYTPLDRIYVKDRDMNTVCYEQVPDSYSNRLVSFLFDENGVPMLLAEDTDGYYTRRVRTEKREEYEPVRLESAALPDMGTVDHIALTEKGLLYIRDGALHLYHLGDKREERLLELAAGGIFEEDVIYLGMRGETIELVDNYKGSETSEYTSFEAGDSQQARLSLGVMTLQPEIRDMVAAFNRYQGKVRIEPVVYVEGYDYDAGYERLKLDVIQGKAPDLIATYGIDYEILANKGAFLDLYEFMEKDSECGREQLLPNVLKAYELEGHLYTIAPTFHIYTMWGGGSLVQGRSGLNMGELIQVLQENGGDINSICGFSADESVLRTLCSLGMGEFINWKEGTCDFTGEAFRELMEFAKEYKGVPYESFYRAIRNKEIKLTLGLITSVEDYRLESELYGENIQFIGYPTSEGTGSAVLFSGNALAVNAKTGHPEEAWEFIKYFLLHGYDGRDFPVVKEQFDDVMEASMEETAIEENGQVYSVLRKYYHEQNVVSLEIYKAEPGDVDAVRALVEKATGKVQYYNRIQNIIDEEAEAYFKGQKSLEMVMEIIQNRVQVYLDER